MEKYTVFDYGLASVTDTDLLTLIVNDRKTVEYLAGYSVYELARKSYSDFAAMGMSEARAKRLAAAFELNRRKTQDQEPQQLTSSRDAFNIMWPVLSELLHEEFHVIYLSRSNKVIKVWQASKGGISGTVTDIRMILKEALNLSACFMVCVHNHPSGNTMPSTADTAITKKLNESAKIMDIKLLDHVIIAGHSYFSFADEGII